MNDLKTIAIALSLLAFGPVACAQFRPTGPKTPNAGPADDGTQSLRPEPLGNISGNSPTHPGDAVPYAGTISLHEMSIPEKARRAYNKGVQQFDTNDLGKSVLNAQRAIKFAPGFYEAYDLLGLAEFSLRDWDAAEEAFRRSIELSRDTFAAPLFGLGMVLSRRKEFVEAEAMILEGLRLDPADAKGRFCLAAMQYLAGRFPEAEQSARQAMAYNSTYPGPYGLLAQIHHLQDNPAAEIDDLKNYLKLEPAGPLTAEARAALADAEHRLAKENIATPTKP